jgi:hypothetical protein
LASRAGRADEAMEVAQLFGWPQTLPLKSDRHWSGSSSKRNEGWSLASSEGRCLRKDPFGGTIKRHADNPGG